MLQARRLMRPFAVATIVGASLLTSVTISAIESKSSGGGSVETPMVGEGAVANRSAARTGVRTVTAQPESPTPPTPPSRVSPAEQRILELVNIERTSRGLQPVTFDDRLNVAAEAHSAHQGRIGTIFHIAPDGTTPGERMTAAGYTFRAWAENVAAGQTTPESVMAAWMASPGHCRNILNPAYVHLGVGHVVTDTSFRNWWTQKFATPSGTRTPPGTYDPSWC